MASWPSSLPNPLSAGYGLDPVDPVIRTDMEVGSPRSRRRTSARDDRIPVSWLMTDAQMATFRSWYENDSTGIAGGAAWFSINLNLGTGGIYNWEARFTSIYSAEFLCANRWRVSARLEVRDFILDFQESISQSVTSSSATVEAFS